MAAAQTEFPSAMLPEPHAIVVRTPNWLGDLMMSTGFLEALLQRFPGVPVDLIVREGFEALPLPRRGAVWPFDRRHTGAGAFGRKLRGRGYSHFFVLPPSFSSAWMAFRSGVPVRVGHRGQGRAPLLRPALGGHAPPRSRHLALEYMDLLRPWGVRSERPPRLHLPVDASWRQAHLPRLLDGRTRYVVLAPGAEYGPAKQWPLAAYRALAQGLAASGWPVAVAGLAKDRAAANALLADVPHAINLCGATGLLELVALLAGAALLVSNDSGAMHIGAALGIPQIALFGSTNPVWTGPLNSRARVLYRALACSPCYARDCPLGHTNCLREIGPAEVLEHAQAALAQGPAGSATV